MSDPLEVLRTSARIGAPDVGAIKSRARRIERRRRVAISSAAVVIVALAVGGVLLRPGGGSSNTTTVAQPQLNSTVAPGAEANAAAAPPAPSNTTAPVTRPTAQTYATNQRAAGKAGSGGQAAPMAAPAPVQDSSGSLQLTVTAAGAGPHMERFTLNACNGSDHAVAPTFPTGQRYDFEVRRNGSLVWRWSDGMAFTQIYGQESWAPKQCKTYTATWSAGTQPTGSYQVTGIVASSPRQSTAPRAFCLDLC